MQGSLTDVPGIRVGHASMPGRPTGCTVVLPPEGTVGGVTQPGGAPGTREIALLDPTNTVAVVHGVVLSGGSAFGLEAATGVVRYLEEHEVGFPAGPAKVPIVVGAILFDLGVGEDPAIRPDAGCGYRAAAAASAGPVASGNVGAGLGATVGKLAGPERAMKGGLGNASIELGDGLVIAALVAVNAVGDVLDPSTGRIVAGVRTADGKALADARSLLLRPPRHAAAGAEPVRNTTIAIVATNARLDKAQANRLALMASAGMARAIVPVWTPMDGDTVFALATGASEARVDLSRLGALAAEALSRAIVDAARSAESLAGIPASRDLEPSSTETPP